MKDKYQTYRAVDFAQDQAFIRWVQHNRAKDRMFWANWLRANPQKEGLIEEAQSLVRQIQFNQKTLDQDRKQALWDRIDSNTTQDTPVVSLKKKKSTRLVPYAIAASLLALAAFWFIGFDGGNVEIITRVADWNQHTLPDESMISINADSRIAYNEKKWASNRTLTLNGQAYFSVEKGQKWTFL